MTFTNQHCREWIKIDAEIDGVEHASIMQGTSVELSASESFWIMGGMNYEKQVLEETIFFDTSSSMNKFQQGISLPKHVYGHCTTNIKIPL